MRATIRQRGTARMVLMPAALAGWAALTIGAAAVITVALGTLIPLLVLVAAFESVFALHVNVERIGRYLQVFHERAHAGWEHVAMDVRRAASPAAAPIRSSDGSSSSRHQSTSSRPRSAENRWEVAIVAVCHFAFIYRVRKAQSLAASIRAEDLQRFEALAATEPGGNIAGHSIASRTSNPLSERRATAARIQSVGVVIQRSPAPHAPSQTDATTRQRRATFAPAKLLDEIAAHAATLHTSRFRSSAVRDLLGVGLGASHDESSSPTRIHNARVWMRDGPLSGSGNEPRDYLRRGEGPRLPAPRASPQSHA